MECDTHSDCIISLRLQQNGCPITGAWCLGEVTDLGCWEFTVDDCAAEWGLIATEIAAAENACRQFTRGCNGYTDPRDVVRQLRSYGERAETI